MEIAWRQSFHVASGQVALALHSGAEAGVVAFTMVDPFVAFLEPSYSANDCGDSASSSTLG